MSILSSPLLWAAEKLQLGLSKLVWYCCVRPTLFVAHWFTPRELREEYGKGFIEIDRLQWKGRLLAYFARKVLKLNDVLQGTKNVTEMYSHLLLWNPAIPLRGSVIDKTKFQVNILGDRSFRGGEARPVDPLLLQDHSSHGKFTIVEKYEENGSFYIKCVWISGESIGKTFDIGWPPKLDSGTESPSTVYFPPKLLVFLIEALLSISLLSTLLRLIYEFRAEIVSFFQVPVEFFFEAWSVILVIG